MQACSSTRQSLCAPRLRAGGLLFCVLMVPQVLHAARQQRPAVVQHTAPVRPAPKAAPNAQGPRNQEHLAEWMNRHRDLSLQQQQKALEGEPGFREYPAQTQQRLRDRLTQLNNMRPAQRERILELNEATEHLSPPQRQQVGGAVRQLGSLPEDRRHAVARAFRDLRAMPEGERQQYMNSPAFRSQYNDQERSTLNNLMSVEPYLPGKRTNEAPPQ